MDSKEVFLTFFLIFCPFYLYICIVSQLSLLSSTFTSFPSQLTSILFFILSHFLCLHRAYLVFLIFYILLPSLFCHSVISFPLRQGNCLSYPLVSIADVNESNVGNHKASLIPSNTWSSIFYLLTIFSSAAHVHTHTPCLSLSLSLSLSPFSCVALVQMK